jgi:glutamate decarboxylase
LTTGEDIPVFAWSLKPGHTSKWDLYDLSHKLREYGWQVPAYPLPANLQDTTIMRVVVRNGFSMDLAHLFLADFKDAVRYLDALTEPMPKAAPKRVGFHH